MAGKSHGKSYVSLKLAPWRAPVFIGREMAVLKLPETKSSIWCFIPVLYLHLYESLHKSEYSYPQQPEFDKIFLSSPD